MKQLLAAAVCAALAMSGIALAADAPELKSEREKLSYSVGMDIGANLKRQSIDVDAELLTKGFRDSYTGAKTLLTEEESRQAIQNFQKQMMAKQAEAAKQMAEKNKAEGEKFLAENGKKDGVKTTASGLQYKVIREGAGKSPTADNTVEVHYKGTLIDGKEFDSSYTRNQTATFPVSGVIPGWTEGLQLMKEGGKYMLFVPSNLAYGERGAGRDIGPNATLVFEVELISVQ
ncbi:MAG: FKBP-type peptidyl-prolyl cis-trans isomerase [Deltaproteobacteria bacterium]|nr:FKBP-type peptidyl-prolyl cis-trans isomerase [Deltaproteobacteria bacterium]